MTRIKMPEFPSAKEALSEDNGSFSILSTVSIEEFWCEGAVLLQYDYKRKCYYVEAELTYGDFSVACSGPVYCEYNATSIKSAYVKAVKGLHSFYTEWVYKNILQDGMTTPKAEQ